MSSASPMSLIHSLGQICDIEGAPTVCMAALGMRPDGSFALLIDLGGGWREPDLDDALELGRRYSTCGPVDADTSDRVKAGMLKVGGSVLRTLVGRIDAVRVGDLVHRPDIVGVIPQDHVRKRLDAAAVPVYRLAEQAEDSEY